VCATNRDLAADVRGRRFRSDLFYGINVFPNHVPPLRERRPDVALLANAILADLGKRLGRRVEIEADAMASPSTCDWPGNVRQLENAIERAVIVAPGPRLTIDDFADFGGAFANVEDDGRRTSARSSRTRYAAPKGIRPRRPGSSAPAARRCNTACGATASEPRARRPPSFRHLGVHFLAASRARKSRHFPGTPLASERPS
jgi:transcriptional regulator with GAF, ATPase, and Fis domain